MECDFPSGRALWCHTDDSRITDGRRPERDSTWNLNEKTTAWRYFTPSNIFHPKFSRNYSSNFRVATCHVYELSLAAAFSGAVTQWPRSTRISSTSCTTAIATQSPSISRRQTIGNLLSAKFFEFFFAELCSAHTRAQAEGQHCCLLSLHSFAFQRKNTRLNKRAASSYCKKWADQTTFDYSKAEL